MMTLQKLMLDSPRSTVIPCIAFFFTNIPSCAHVLVCGEIFGRMFSNYISLKLWDATLHLPPPSPMSVPYVSPHLHAYTHLNPHKHCFRLFSSVITP